MLRFAIFLFSIIGTTSCGQNKIKQEKSNVSDSELIDTKNKLNIQIKGSYEIDSSGVVMFPLSMGESEKDRDKVSYKDIPSSSFWNIIFFDSKANKYHLLDERKMLILNYDLNYSSNNDNAIIQTSNHIFYNVIVDDYNNDKILNYDDPEYLFVSDRNGMNFRRISPPSYDLQSWQFIKSSNKVIMTVKKDSDDNRKFDIEDEVTVFEIEIDKGIEPLEVFPDEFKSKLKLIYDKNWKRMKQ
jgi:hypothetical protein